MSDSTSAETYSTIFRLLGSDPTPQHKKWARVLWKEQEQRDFHPSDMEQDKALIALGLAKRGTHPVYPEDGEMTLYLGLDYGRGS